MWMLIYRTQYAEINRTVVVRRLTGECVALANSAMCCTLSRARCLLHVAIDNLVVRRPAALGLVHQWALLDDLGSSRVQ